MPGASPRLMSKKNIRNYNNNKISTQFLQILFKSLSAFIPLFTDFIILFLRPAQQSVTRSLEMRRGGKWGNCLYIHHCITNIAASSFVF